MAIPFAPISKIVNLISSALRGAYYAMSINERLQQAKQQASNAEKAAALAKSAQPVKTNLVLDPKVIDLLMRKQGLEQKLLEIQQQELELKELQFEAYFKVETARDEREQERNQIERKKAEVLEAKRRDEIELSRLHRALMRDLQRQEIEQRKSEVEANWDQVNWFSSLSKNETQEILLESQEHPRLLVLLAPLKIAASCPFQEDLPAELEHELRIFLGENYPLDEESSPVQFYGGYFKRPITDAELEKLKLVLSPVSTVIIQTSITGSKVLINLGFWDFQSKNVLHLPIKAWDWQQLRESLAVEDISLDKQQFLIQEVIILLNKALCAYITDAYYLSLDPYYEPKLLGLKDEFSQIDEAEAFLKPYLESLQTNRQEKIVAYEREVKMQQQKQVWRCINTFSCGIDNTFFYKTILTEFDETEFDESVISDIEKNNSPLKVSPDGKSLLYGERLLEIPSGRLLRLLSNGQYSPDGKLVYSVSRNLTKLYNSHTGTLIDNLPGEVVAFDKNNEIVFLRSQNLDGKVFTKVWDLASRTVKFKFLGSFLTHTSKTNIVVTTIASDSWGSKDKLSLWNSTTGELLGENKDLNFRAIKDFIVSPNEKYILVTAKNYKLLLELETRKKLLDNIGPMAHYLELKDQLLLEGSYGKELNIWSFEIGEILYSLPLFSPKWVQLNPIQNLIATASKNGNDVSIYIRDLFKGKLVEKIDFSEAENLKRLFFSSNGNFLIVQFDYEVYIWQCSNWGLVNKVRVYSDNVEEFDVSSDGRFLLDIGSPKDSSIKYIVYSVETKQKIQDFFISKRYSSDGVTGHFKNNYLVIIQNSSCFSKKLTQVWDVETGEEVFNHDLIQVYSPDKQTLVQEAWNESTATCDLHILDPETKELLQILPGHAGSITQIEFSQDGQTMVSLGGDLAIKVWQKEREALPEE